MQLQCTCFPKVLSHLVTGYDKFPTNKTYFWDRSLNGLGAGLSSDADFRFHKEAAGLGILAWFCDRGLLSSSCVISLVSVYSEQCAFS